MFWVIQQLSLLHQVFSADQISGDTKTAKWKSLIIAKQTKGKLVTSFKLWGQVLLASMNHFFVVLLANTVRLLFMSSRCKDFLSNKYTHNFHNLVRAWIKVHTHQIFCTWSRNTGTGQKHLSVLFTKSSSYDNTQCIIESPVSNSTLSFTCTYTLN